MCKLSKLNNAKNASAFGLLNFFSNQSKTKMILIYLFYSRGLLANDLNFSKLKSYGRFQLETETENFSMEPKFNSSCDTESFVAATYCEDRVLINKNCVLSQPI